MGVVVLSCVYDNNGVLLLQLEYSSSVVCLKGSGQPICDKLPLLPRLR